MSDTNLAKICLPPNTTQIYPPINSTLVAIGWGSLAQGGSLSLTLQQVTLQAVSYSSIGCQPLVYDTTKQFCATVNDSSKDTCQGDSGGPIMMFTSTQQWIVVGITSYGHGCAVAPYASVYTRLTSYSDWMNSVNVTDSVTIVTPTTPSTTTTSTTTTPSTTTSTTSTPSTTTTLTTTTTTTSTTTSTSTSTTTASTTTTSTTSTTTTPSTTTTSTTTTTTTST
ncbi:unnamed protein product, partial [Adineta steineri]